MISFKASPRCCPEHRQILTCWRIPSHQSKHVLLQRVKLLLLQGKEEPLKQRVISNLPRHPFWNFLYWEHLLWFVACLVKSLNNKKKDWSLPGRTALFEWSKAMSTDYKPTNYFLYCPLVPGSTRKLLKTVYIPQALFTILHVCGWSQRIWRKWQAFILCRWKPPPHLPTSSPESLAQWSECESFSHCVTKALLKFLVKWLLTHRKVSLNLTPAASFNYSNIS